LKRVVAFFVSFGFVRRRPITRSIGFDEIAAARIDMVGGDPDVTLTLMSGKRLRFQGTRPDRKQFPDFIQMLQKRIGSSGSMRTQRSSVRVDSELPRRRDQVRWLFGTG
jgi:hypothetical protein